MKTLLPNEPWPSRWRLRLTVCAALVLCQQLSAVAATNSVPTVETLVCIRHAEKPPGGLGQLNCRGLNRALALPKVLLGKFGAPQFIFAPSTSEKTDSGKPYNYLRPLATIEPTAIRCGLPVNTRFNFKQISALGRELRRPAYQNALVFVAWEHKELDDFVKDMVKRLGGDPASVPPWEYKDFDSIFIVKITRDGRKTSVGFSIDHEGLNNLPADCPGN